MAAPKLPYCPLSELASMEFERNSEAHLDPAQYGPRAKK
jgi:hypothetical protein